MEDDEDKDDDDDLKEDVMIRRLYREQACIYLQKGRECFIQAMKKETMLHYSDDAHVENENDETFMMMQQQQMSNFEQLNDLEKKQRVSVFHNLFVEKQQQQQKQKQQQQQQKEEAPNRQLQQH